MNAFDFDNTLYQGESSLDFALYMMRYNRKIFLYLPVILVHAVRYKLCLVDKSHLEKILEKYLARVIRSRQETEELLISFWQGHSYKLDEVMLQRISPEDVILSAGPRFLLEGISSRLNTRNLLCSEVDLDRKKVLFFNFGDNKACRFRKQFGNCKIACFYTDSYNDRAIMDISDKVFLVKRRKLKQIKGDSKNGYDRS